MYLLSTDVEAYGSNNKQFVKTDEIQPQSLDLQVQVDVLRKWGLNKAVIDYTIEALRCKSNHQMDKMYYIEKCIEEMTQSYPQDNCLTVLELCFEEATARELEMCLTQNSLFEHESLQYWMCLYVEYVNDQEDNRQRFINNGTQIGSWFSSRAFFRKTSFSISCINQDYNHSSNSIATLLSNFGPSQPDDYWYHGTTQKAADNIRNGGISLGNGRVQQDFSHGWGFYLNRNIEDAKNWAIKPYQKATGAVLIYDFSLNDFEGIDLSYSERLWKNTVKYYRRGATKDIIDNEKELENVDYIFGPMSKGGFGSENETWEPRIKPGKYQLCIKSSNMARQISPALKGIIYLSN